ncbi:MAG: AarF/ABC1/UbiB kinase family protein [Deltaproteobacteria bacterium]|nr:AarF/ABC1/UbiB kinase family protein [Deltaproteobacteria bacterium]
MGVFRFFAQLAICSWYGLRYLAGRIRLIFVRDPEAKRARLAHLRGRTARLAMTRLGATFIKLGQVMSTRRDIFEPEMIAELRQLQDELPAFGEAAVRAIVREELDQELDEAFDSFDPVPIAAASVAQVHRATLGGRELAVKILRPDVRANVMRDAVLLRAGARMGSWHPKLKLSDPVGHLEHFIQGILDQTDLRLEAENNRQFRENFAELEWIVFPELVDELCSERVLTMDYIPGEKVDELPEGDHSLLADRLAHCFLKMCFEDGFLHADLHPGNFSVLPDSHVGVYDLGLAKRLPDDLLEEFIDFSKCMAMGTAADMTEHMQRFHTYMDGVDWETMEKDMASLVGKFRGQTKGELEMGAMFDEMFALGRKYRVRPRTELTLILVGMITAEGVGKMLDPDVDTFAQVAQFITPIVAQRAMARASAS